MLMNAWGRQSAGASRWAPEDAGSAHAEAAVMTAADDEPEAFELPAAPPDATPEEPDVGADGATGSPPPAPRAAS